MSIVCPGALKLLNSMSELANAAIAMPVNCLKLEFILLFLFYLRLRKQGRVIFHVGFRHLENCASVLSLAREGEDVKCPSMPFT